MDKGKDLNCYDILEFIETHTKKIDDYTELEIKNVDLQKELSIIKEENMRLKNKIKEFEKKECDLREEIKREFF